MKTNTLRRRISTVLGAALVGAGLLSSGAAIAQSEPLTVVNAGFVPGIFKKHGLQLKANVASTGAVPAVMSGEYHFGFTALVNVLQARDKGLPIKIIAAGSSSTGVKGADVTMIHAGPKSGVKSAKDLEGKTVSVNALNGLLQMMGKAAVKADGGDPAKVRFIELGFAEALAALEAGRTDAMVGAEPFGTAAIGAGFPPIASPYQALSTKSMLTSSYFTSESQLAANPELFKKIRAAINESLEYAQKNHDQIRKQLPKFTKLGPDVAAKLILPSYLTAIPREAVETFSKTGLEFGMLNKPAVYDAVVWTAGK